MFAARQRGDLRKCYAVKPSGQTSCRQPAHIAARRAKQMLIFLGGGVVFVRGRATAGVGVDEVTLSSLACDKGLPVPTRLRRWHTGGAREERSHSGPHSLPVAVPSLFTRRRRTVNRHRQHLPNPPRLLCSVVQILASPPNTLSPPLPNPLVPLPTIICLPPHTPLGSPNQMQKFVTPESQQVFLHLPSAPLMKPDCHH